MRAFYALPHLVVDIGSEVVEAHSKSSCFCDLELDQPLSDRVGASALGHHPGVPSSLVQSAPWPFQPGRR